MSGNWVKWIKLFIASLAMTLFGPFTRRLLNRDKQQAVLNSHRDWSLVASKEVFKYIR
jgi:hypothetical protein